MKGEFRRTKRQAGVALITQCFNTNVLLGSKYVTICCCQKRHADKVNNYNHLAYLRFQSTVLKVPQTKYKKVSK